MRPGSCARARVAKVLKKHRIRRIDAPEVLRRLRVCSFPVAPGTTQAVVAHIESLGERLALVQSQLRARTPLVSSTV